MSLPKETYEAMKATIEKAVAPLVIKAPAEPDHIYYLRYSDGRLERREADPAPLNHQVLDVPTLVEIANDCGVETADRPAAPVAVWCNINGIVAILDTTASRDCAKLPLTWSKPFKLLNRWCESNGGTVNQKELVHELLTTFFGCVGPELLASIRQVRVTANSDGATAIAHGKASMSRAALSEAIGATDIPDSVYFNIPLFTNAGFGKTYKVACVIEINPVDPVTFTITPMAAMLEEAQNEAIDDMRIMLRAEKLDESIPIYAGRP